MKKINKKFIVISDKNKNILQLFIDHLRAKNKSPHTLYNYQKDVEEFLYWYELGGNHKIEKVTKRTISEYIKSLSSTLNSSTSGAQIHQSSNKKNLWQSFLKVFYKGQQKGSEISQTTMSKNLSPSSRRRKISALSQFYSYLVADEVFGKKLIVNPVNSILHNVRLKDVDIQHTVRLSRDEFEVLIEKNWRPREQLILHLLFWGGLRLAELTRLKKDSLNSETQTLTLVRKGGSVHKLKIEHFSRIEFLWNRYLQGMKQYSLNNGDENKSEYLFASKLHLLSSSRPITERAMVNIIQNCFKKAHITNRGLSPHSFRKGCATELYFKTKDLLYVRDYLNHQDAKVTQTYIDMIV